MLSSALFVWRVFHFVLVHLTGQRFRHQQSVRRLAIYVSSSAAFAGPHVLVLSTDKEIGQGALHSLRTVHLLLYHISMPCNNLHTHWKSAPIYHICRSGILWGQPTFGLFSLDRHVIMNNWICCCCEGFYNGLCKRFSCWKLLQIWLAVGDEVNLSKIPRAKQLSFRWRWWRTFVLTYELHDGLWKGGCGIFCSVL